MSSEQKISPAFIPFLEESGPDNKRDAIVIYKTPEQEGVRVRGHAQKRKMRGEHVKSRAAAQKAVEKRVFSAYREAGRDVLRGGEELEVSSIGSQALPAARVEVTRSTLPALAEQPEVVAVLPNQKIGLIEPRKVSYAELRASERNATETWGLQMLEAERLWETTQGEGVTVAVLDSGVYGEHPALEGRVQDFVVIDPLGRRIETTRSFDGGQHGTHVCGTIAGGRTTEGVAIGMAPRADLVVGGVLIGNSTLRTLMEGLSWAIEKGADIINMSLGFSYYEPLFATVFQLLLDQYDILPVVAIGNENHGNTSSPGSAYNAFSVGAIEMMQQRSLNVSSFSSGASFVFPDQQENGLVTKPDVVAPGAQIYSCIPPEQRPEGPFEYTYMDGTSMATPHVAGVAALLMAARPEATATDIIRALKETSRHPRGLDLRPDNRWGYGVIQPVEALHSLHQIA